MLKKRKKRKKKREKTNKKMYVRDTDYVYIIDICLWIIDLQFTMNIMCRVLTKYTSFSFSF